MFAFAVVFGEGCTGCMQQAQEAFLEGHVAAFEACGGVLRGMSYDNLTAAVARC